MHPLMAALSRGIERLLYRFRFPVNVEVFIAKLFAPNMRLDSQNYRSYTNKILYKIKNKEFNRKILEDIFLLIVVSDS